MNSLYRWKIDKDYLSKSKPEYVDDPNVCSDCGKVLTAGRVKIGYCRQHSSVGVEGPRDLDETVTANPQGFTLYDDDNVAYYHGWLYGDYEGFEPVYDFGMPNAGAVHIKFDGDENYL